MLKNTIAERKVINTFEQFVCNILTPFFIRRALGTGSDFKKISHRK
jgi:hypothetical protein